MACAMHADKSIRTSDMRFAYHRHGKSRQAVVHGWPQTSRAWHQVMQLVRSGYCPRWLPRGGCRLPRDIAIGTAMGAILSFKREHDNGSDA